MLTSITLTVADTIILKGYDTSQEEYDSMKEDTIRIVGMNLTSECNYRCPYCFVGSENLRTSLDEMTTAQKLNLIEQAKDCGAKVLIICGKGEPFADTAIWEIIEKASSLDMWIIIYTNGSLITQSHLYELNKANVSIMLKVDSLDSIDYEASTGQKSPSDNIRSWVLMFRDSLPPFSATIEDTIICRLGINAVVSKANERSIRGLARFCHEQQILLSCRVAQKTGNAIQNWTRLVGDDQDRLNKLANECSMRTVSSQAPNDSCSIYRYGVTIENNGDIYMCPNSRVFQNRIGNVCEEPLAILLKRRVKMYPLDFRPRYCFVRSRNK